MPTSLEWYQEAERRGLINQLSQEQQDWWAEAKRRGLAGTSTQEEQTQPEEEQATMDSPGYIQGGSRALAEGVVGGIAPITAGVTNVTARTLGSVAGALIERDPSLLKGLDPRKYGEYYQEGKEEFKQTQKAFGDEHPVASALSKGLGMLGGVALTGGTVGAATKGAVAATKLGQAGRFGTVASRTAGEIATFGTYDAVREGFDSGEFDALAALKGGFKGGALGGVFGVMGGGIEAAEPTLIKKATELIGNPKASNILVKSLGLAAEGATIGAAPAMIERKMPTAKDIAVGEAFALGGRGAAEVLSRAGKGAWKFANEPTKMQAEELRARASEISKAQEKADTAVAEEIAATKERRSLETQGASAEAIKEAKANEDWAAATRDQAEQNLEEAIAGKPVQVQVKITPEQEEIDAYMKQHASNPNMTEEKARIALEHQKMRAAERIRPEQQLPLKERILRSAKELTSKTIQQFNWLRPVEEGVLTSEVVTGEKVAADKNPVYTLNKLRNGGEQEALIRPVFQAVENVEKKFPGSVDGARAYLEAAKKVQFARAEGKEVEQGLLDILDMYKDDAPVQEIVRSVRELNDKVLNRLKESGRIDTATYLKLKENDAYVPSWVEKFDEAGEQIVANDAESYLRKFTGAGRVYQNPITTSMEQAKRIDQFAEMQKAKKQYIDLAKKTGQANRYEVIEDYKGGPIKFDKKEQIVVWNEGKPEIWNVPERVADYFNPAPIPKSGKIEGFFKTAAAMPLRIFKGATTAASLGFAESNIPRDVSGALFGSQYGGNISASMLASSTKELINKEPIVDALRKEIGAQTLRDVEQLPGVAEDNVQKFLDMYNSINKSVKTDSPMGVIAKLFTISLPDYARKAARFTKNTSRKGLEMLSYTGNLSEETTRLSVFKSVLQASAKNDAEYQLWLRKPDLIPADVRAKAGNEAREVTLNFNRQMAKWVETANRYFAPYFKPAILGGLRGMTMLSNPDIAPRAWRYIINMGIMQGLIKGKIADKQQLEDLDAINNEISGKTLIIPGEKGRLWTIPLGQELAPFVSMFAGVTEKMYRGATKQQREDISREMVHAGRQMIENYAPVYGYIATPSNFALGGPIPKTILEEWTNKDFFTRTPIVPQSQEGKPVTMQQTKSTPALAIQLSKSLARHGINISPLRIRHISSGLFSNVAKEMFSVSDGMLSEFGIGPLRPKKEVQDSPYTRRLIADITAPYNQYSQDANEIVDEAKRGYKAIEEGEEVEWSPKQKLEYEMQDEIYDSIKPDVDALKKLYKQRAEEEKAFAEDASDLKKQLREKKISKVEYKNKWNQLESELKEFEEEQTLEERTYQMSIISIAKEIKESYKKAPKK